jgi:putative thioredoxin
MADHSPWIVDTTSASFETDVLERSKQVPVVVDFWAPWCGPCRQLGPILETLARQADGRFVLVKLDIEANQEIAALIGVQSIPLVVAFRDGRPVNQFVGVMPEEEIRDWLESFMPSEADTLLAEGESLESSDPAAAEAKYRKALALDPNNASLKIHLARVLHTLRRAEESAAFIAELEARGFLEPEAEQIKAQLDLEGAAEEAGGVDEARKAVAANPNNPSLKLKLADTLAVSRKHEEALQLCLEIIQQDKEGIGVQAKETMVKIFDLPGISPELVSTYRRRLATAFY